MISSAQLGQSLHLAAIVVPVALYFLILGLLNSRRHPQLLTGRRDFALLFGALSPLFVVPAVSYMGASPLGTLIVIAAIAAGVALVLPRRHAWVIYNLPADRAVETIEAALGEANLYPVATQRGFKLQENNAFLEIAAFPLLNNVSLRLRDGDVSLARQVEASLASQLARTTTDTSPMAMSLLLVATVMLVAPLAMVAPRVPEIVRLLTGLLD